MIKPKKFGAGLLNVVPARIQKGIPGFNSNRSKTKK
jgi:hypothetical protein